jgi:hypothetical protein
MNKIQREFPACKAGRPVCRQRQASDHKKINVAQMKRGSIHKSIGTSSKHLLT